MFESSEVILLQVLEDHGGLDVGIDSLQVDFSAGHVSNDLVEGSEAFLGDVIVELWVGDGGFEGFKPELMS